MLPNRSILVRAAALLRQPSTILSMAVLVAVSVALVEGSMSLTMGAPILVGALLMAVVPDNTLAADKAGALVAAASAPDASRQLALIVLLRGQLPGLVSWLRQPTTITGLSAIAGAAAGLLDGTMSWAVGGPILAGAVVAAAIPEQPGASAATLKLVGDLLLLLNPARRVEALTRIGADVAELVPGQAAPVNVNATAVAVPTAAAAIVTN